jgi:hypothetical protein
MSCSPTSLWLKALKQAEGHEKFYNKNYKPSLKDKHYVKLAKGFYNVQKKACLYGVDDDSDDDDW